MSDTPNYDAATGRPMYDPATGLPAMDCCGGGPVCQFRWSADYCPAHHWVVSLVSTRCGTSTGPSDTGWIGSGTLRHRDIVTSTACDPGQNPVCINPTPPEPPTDTPVCASSSSSSSSSLPSSSSSQQPGGVCMDAWLATYTCDAGGGGTWAVEYDYTFCSLDGGPPGIPMAVDGTSGWWPLEGTSHFTYACITTNYDQFCNQGVSCEAGPTSDQPDDPPFSPLCLFCQYKFGANYDCNRHAWIVTAVSTTCGSGTPGDTGWTGTGMMRTRTITASTQCEPGDSTACVMAGLPTPPTDTPTCPSSSSSSSSG